MWEPLQRSAGQHLAGYRPVRRWGAASAPRQWSEAKLAPPPCLDYRPRASLTSPRELPGDVERPADRCAIQHSFQLSHGRKMCRYATRQAMRRGLVVGIAVVVAVLALWHPARVAVQALLLLPALFPSAPIDPLRLVSPAPVRDQLTYSYTA